MEFKSIGWIGTGVMGSSMCSHLLKAGFQINVHNRTTPSAATLIEGGARWCDTPREVADTSEVVFSIVGYPEDVEEVILGEEEARMAEIQKERNIPWHLRRIKRVVNFSLALFHLFC